MSKISYQQKIELLKRYRERPQGMSDLPVLREIEIDVVKQSLGVKSAADIEAKYVRYQDFVKRYFKFYDELGQGKPRMGKPQGKAMNDIIRYLLSLENAGNSEDKAYNGWAYILTNWKVLPEFLQRQITLPQINKYIEEITYHFKNATKKGKFDSTDLQAGYDNIDQMYSSK